MLQDIHPHRYDISYVPREARPDDYVAVIRDGTILLREGEAIPTLSELARVSSGMVEELVYLFTIDTMAFYWRAAPEAECPGFEWRSVQMFTSYEPSWLAFAGITASHLAAWYEKNKFCGACASPMLPKHDERALVCSGCGRVIYPGISPAVIVAVLDGDNILLTKYANCPSARHALVAGFMEVGETLEDTVRREVMEEVGVKVKNIRYYKSQPWAFSSSVLMGFFADLDGSPELTVDLSELQEAEWVARDAMEPAHSTMSLTASMMELFRLGNEPR